MKVGVLTSSRADFGVYRPLLEKLKNSDSYALEIIAFGTHLSRYHGYTLDQISELDFEKIHTISSILTNDDENSIATAFGLTVLKFAEFWNQHSFDWVFSLGDRYEMAAAVQAGIPFGVRFAHLHGGDTTLGAIDDIYRHQITLASKKHFPSTEVFADRIKEIIGSSKNIYPVGALSLDGIKSLQLLPEKDFRKKYNILHDFILITFHPETVNPFKNKEYAKTMQKSLEAISKEMMLVITMPNADTFGSVYREAFFELKKTNSDKVVLIENFGKLDYFAAMKYCNFLIGNTSSGIVEAASFNNYVINVGNRQKGRLQSKNVVNVPFNENKLKNAFAEVMTKGEYKGENMYHKEGTASLILKNLKEQQ